MERGNRDHDKGTKANTKSISLLYRKSITTLPGRHSSIRSYKRRTSRQPEYYCDGDRIKKDHSAEADTSTNKLKNNFKHRTSKDSGSLKSLFADGDSSFGTETGTRTIKHHRVVSLIVDNFRCLLNKWIHEYLLDSSDNLEKIEDIRESLLGKLDETLNRSSRSTLRCFKNSFQNLIEDSLLKCETCSNHTVPLQNKHFNMISSLSLPRNVDKQSSGRATRKNACLSINRQTDDLTDSTIILVRLSSQSFTKRCATYNETEKNIQPKTSIANSQLKNALYRATTEGKPSFLKPPYQNIETISLVRNIYGDNHIQEQVRNNDDKETITEEHCNASWWCGYCSRHDRGFKRKQSRKLNNNLNSKHFTYLYRKAGKSNSRCNEFLNHFQTILNYFANYEQQSNIILDVHVNVLPIENTVSNESNTNKTSDHQFNITVINEEKNFRYLDTLMESRESELSSKECKDPESGNRPEIISVLDSSESKNKYISETENNPEEVEVIEHQQWFDHSKTCSSENNVNLLDQIESLKKVIQGLTLVAEKMIIEHSKEKNITTSKSTQVGPSKCNVAVDTERLNFQSASTPINSNHQSYAMWFSQNPMIYNTVPEITKQIISTDLDNLKTSDITSDTAITHPTSKYYPNSDSCKDFIPKDEQIQPLKPSSNQFKGIQFSCNMAGNNTGLKLQTQLKINDPLNLVQKKPSFCYIESESLIKVTDMTSKPEIPVHEMVKEVGLTCPDPALNFEESDGKLARSRIKLYNCGDGFSKRESCSPSHTPYCCQCEKKTRQSEGFLQRIYLNQEKSQVSNQNNQDYIKSYEKSRWLKIGKICVFCLIFCVLVVAVFMVVVNTNLKPAWYKSRTKNLEAEATTPKNSSDLHLLLSEFGF